MQDLPEDLPALGLVTGAVLRDDVVIDFDSGHRLTLADRGQDCCELRYLDTDDDLTDLCGQRLLSIDVESAPIEGGINEPVHEQDFLRIQGERCGVTVCAHNEHNGYYGGIGLCATLTGPEILASRLHAHGYVAQETPGIVEGPGVTQSIALRAWQVLRDRQAKR